jgi:hypothetical protein
MENKENIKSTKEIDCDQYKSIASIAWHQQNGQTPLNYDPRSRNSHVGTLQVYPT